MNTAAPGEGPGTPLAGLRVLVTAIDLEQSEHRGIAVYSKAVIRALRQAGAEIWLLTQFDPPTADVRASRLPADTAAMIFSARVLESLNSGKLSEPPEAQRHPLITRLVLFRMARRARVLLHDLKKSLFPKRQFGQADLKALPVDNIFDNPYLQAERLGYLQDISGLLCASDIFVHSYRLAQRRPGHRVRLELNGFDGIITTCPLNLDFQNVRFAVQTVHDLIPLEYVQTSDNVVGFSRRLRACGDAGRIFVSESTRRKYESAILSPERARSHASCVLTQSPSMNFPADACDWEARIPTLSLYAEGKKRPQPLQPCRYLLFNSSVEPRKNLLFIVNAFIESGLEHQGIKLCVTGKLKADRYSANVKRLVDSHPDVMLTGYVNEATKRQLFLNAMAVVSPSLVEGFGIPVLDAACLGIPVIASASESHREIQQLYDFESPVLLCSTLETSDWASAMRFVAARMERQRRQAGCEDPELPSSEAETTWLDGLRLQRIRRYRQFQKTIENDFTKAICQLIHTEILSRNRVPRQTLEPDLATAAIKARI